MNTIPDAQLARLSAIVTQLIDELAEVFHSLRANQAGF
jgi:hypothetical protein